MDVIEAIKTRRSIRRFKTTPVDDQMLNTVLEAARWSPSWANTQCWRFIVVRDSDTKNQLTDMVGDNPATQALRTAPIVIVCCAELGKSGYYGGKQASDQGDWYMFDVALAMQNLVLAAHSLGLGTVHMGLNFDSRKAAEILGIPQGFRAVEMTPLGYPDGEPKPRPRKELSELVFYDRWARASNDL